MTDLLRAQVVLTHKNGFPRDNVSMNYWFAVDEATEALAEAVADRAISVFNEVVAPRTQALGREISQAISTTGNHVKVYEYDEGTGERLSYDGAPPLADVTWEITPGVGRDSADPYPAEVACCASFSSVSGAVYGGGVLTAPMSRRRGRVFVGPLAPTGASDPTVRTSRPSTSLIDLIGAAHWNLMAQNTTAAKWVVYSRPFAGRPLTPREGRAPLPELPPRAGTAYVIDTVTVDNAWDTQRRRGERATVRTTF